jgi:2,4-dienoyl-CoA reductase-like NADH-dependent reductase (Old Yellow Enzyme family)
MCQYSAEDGFANNWHLVHLGSRAVGGAGLIMAEATAVSPQGRISPGDLGIWKNEHIAFLKTITAFVESQGAVPGIQLAHAGRKASMHRPWEGNKKLSEEEAAWQTEAPSAIAYADSYPMPAEMSISSIQQCITDFAAAAQRALDAGFKVIEIHAAHGYLINQFLSPLSNLRTDEYGSSFGSRIRFLLEIVKAVRNVIGNGIPLFVRISAIEWVDNGWKIADSIALAKILKEIAVDLIDCSSGGNSRDQKIEVGPLYQTPFAEQVKTATGIMTGAVGIITTAEEAENILNEGRADLIFIARQMLREPYFALQAARILNSEINWPVQYERSK